MRGLSHAGELLDLPRRNDTARDYGTVIGRPGSRAGSEGDAGAKRLIGAHRDGVREIAVGSDAIFVDVDTPEALRDVRDGT